MFNREMDLLQRAEKYLLFIYVFTLSLASANFATTYFQPMWVDQLKDYGHLDIFVVTIPEQTLSVVFRFAAAPENDGCSKDLQLDVVLQRESLPLIDELGTFPPGFEVDRGEQRNVTVVANSQVHFLQLIYPKPGQWYGTAFHRLQQSHTVSKLQDKKCRIKMAFNVSNTLKAEVTELVPNAVHALDLTNSSTACRFRSGPATQSYTVTISNCRMKQGNGTMPLSPCPLVLYSSSARVSTQWDYEHTAKCASQASADGQCVLEVNNPDVDQWQYVTVAIESTETVLFQLLVQLYDVRDIVSTVSLDATWPVEMPASLQRIENIYELFSMTFALGEGSSSKLNISDQSGPLVTSFSLQSMRDTGGSLRLHAALSNVNESVTSGRGEEVVVTACLQQGVVPLNGTRVSCANPLTLYANNSHKLTRYVPYPKAGRWFAAFDIACYSSDSLNIGVAAKVPCSKPWYGLIFELGSAACVDGACGSWGDCKQYATGSLMYSSCDCGAGYRGYGCTDSSQLKPLSWQLLDTLLLSLSNLCFIPAIVLASKRLLFMEAIAYTCNMFFSTFYHACDMDEWSTYRLCIMPYHVLQYTDFFCSIMSFWVTLMAMAELPFQVKAITHIIAVYAFSMGLTWKQFGILPYAIPISTGVLIVVLAWSVRSYRQKKCVLSKVRCLTIVPGVLAAVFGMSIYVFMETDDNYPYTHSLWHVCMSLSCVFLLPPTSRRTAGEGRRLREDVCCHEVEMTSENSDDVPIVSGHYTRWMD